MTTNYTLCKHCDHFVDENIGPDDCPTLAKYIHLDDGEQEYDHNAEPSDQTHTLAAWKELRPDLFIQHPDGVGPNSKHHSRRGKM